MTRRFNNRQRLALAIRSAGRCEECQQPLPSAFHADHDQPFSRGGSTTILNGRATCARCNLKKGNASMKLRDWQQAAREKALTYFSSAQLHPRFVVNAAPGAGKTRLACVIAGDLIATGDVDRVIIIAPRKTVVDQWALDFQKTTGRHMMRVTAPDDVVGFQDDICATWAAVKSLKDIFQIVCASSKVLVICDEHHHAAITAAWGASADSAFKDAAYSLILTGTPLRSDGAASVWLGLDEIGGIDHPAEGMYTLTYGEAVELGYCRPVTFHRHRGVFTVDLENGTEAIVPNDGPPVLPPGTPVDNVLRRVIDFQRLAKKPQYEADNKTPCMQGYQATMVACAREKLDEIQLTMPDAAALVIAPDITTAEYFARVIEKAEGEKPTIAHSSITNAEGRIVSFRKSKTKRWLVTVGMVTEGVDIPRLRILVYLPAAGTELAFRQAVGRVVRNNGHQDSSRAYVVMPALSSFEEYARRIEEDMPALGTTKQARPVEKICSVCGGGNEVSVRECEHCGAEFAARQQTFRTCECGAFNRVTDARCNCCGLDLTARFKITLAAAARDGVISRGIDLAEEDVVEAENLAPAHRNLLARAEQENQVLAKILRTVPLELLPQLFRLIRPDDQAPA